MQNLFFSMWRFNGVPVTVLTFCAQPRIMHRRSQLRRAPFQLYLPIGGSQSTLLPTNGSISTFLLAGGSINTLAPFLSGVSPHTWYAFEPSVENVMHRVQEAYFLPAGGSISTLLLASGSRCTLGRKFTCTFSSCLVRF